LAEESRSVHAAALYDTVRVAALVGPAEEHLVATGDARPPRVGETGMVFQIVPYDEPPTSDAQYYVVHEEWMAAFTRDELELLSLADRAAPDVPA
jgi:hypothetical protein